MAKNTEGDIIPDDYSCRFSIGGVYATTGKPVLVCTKKIGECTGRCASWEYEPGTDSDVRNENKEVES